MEQGKIPVKLLSGINDSPMWKYRIKLALNYYPGALDVVEGKLEKPGEPNVADDESIFGSIC